MKPSNITSCLAAVLLAIPFLAASEQPTFAKTWEQAAYEVCSKSNNKNYRFLTGHKAMVCGANARNSNSYFVWNARSSKAALNRAMSNCRREYSYCVVWGTDRGWSAWAADANRRGGITRSEADARAENRSRAGGDDPFLDAFLGAAIGAMNGYVQPRPRAAPRHVPSRQLYRGSRRCPGATIAVDENCRPLH